MKLGLPASQRNKSMMKGRGPLRPGELSEPKTTPPAKSKPSKHNSSKKPKAGY